MTGMVKFQKIPKLDTGAGRPMHFMENGLKNLRVNVKNMGIILLFPGHIILFPNVSVSFV